VRLDTVPACIVLNDVCATPFFFRRRCKVGSRLSVNLVLGVLSVGLTNKANPFSLELREGRY